MTAARTWVPSDAAIFTLAIHLGKRWTRHTPPNNKEHAE